MNEAFRQIERSGYRPYLIGWHVEANRVEGIVDLAIIDKLREDERFQEGLLHGLHADVGEDRTEFRSFKGEFGKGSLQIVICKTDGSFEADVDKFSPYMDVIGFVGHAGEVIGSWFKRWRGERAEHPRNT